jgi:hypothetical protein
MLPFFEKILLENIVPKREEIYLIRSWSSEKFSSITTYRWARLDGQAA